MKFLLNFIMVLVVCIVVNRFFSMLDYAKVTDLVVVNSESVLMLNKQIEILETKIKACNNSEPIQQGALRL